MSDYQNGWEDALSYVRDTKQVNRGANSHLVGTLSMLFGLTFVAVVPYALFFDLAMRPIAWGTLPLGIGLLYLTVVSWRRAFRLDREQREETAAKWQAKYDNEGRGEYRDQSQTQ